MGRAVLQCRPPRRGRMGRRAGDPLQEPAISGASARRGPPVGLPDPARHRKQERERRVVPGLPQHHGLSHSDGHPRRAGGIVDEPEPGAPADLHGHSRWGHRHKQRPIRAHRRRAAGGPEREVRRHLEPDLGFRGEPRLLADRIRRRANRGQPAVSAVLLGAAAVLSRRTGNLQYPGAGHADSHSDDRRPGVRRQNDRQGRPDVARRPRGERRSTRQGGVRRDRFRPVSIGVPRSRSLRLLSRVLRRRGDHGS